MTPTPAFDANATGGKSFGDLPEWDLTDLYTAPDAPEFGQDMDWLEAACATFANDFQVSIGINNLLDDRQRMTRNSPVRGTFVPVTVPLMWDITTPRNISLTRQKNFE